MDAPRTRPLNSEDGEVDEATLVAGLQAGDEAAFDEAVRRFGPHLLAVARRFMGHEQDAQDVVQDAFLSAFKAINNFQGDAKLSTWLHRIAVNASLMKLRSRKRNQERPIDDLLPKFQDNGHMADAAARWAVTHDTAVDSREMRELVRHGIDQLPEAHRTILLLRDIEGHSTEETAKLLDITPGAVKTRLHRARQALRTLLDPHMRGALA
ncbi:MAG: sigma-70 family RNA polymerase sigma factor [Pirellulaceae bacterium]